MKMGNDGAFKEDAEVANGAEVGNGGVEGERATPGVRRERSAGWTRHSMVAG